MYTLREKSNPWVVFTCTPDPASPSQLSEAATTLNMVTPTSVLCPHVDSPVWPDEPDKGKQGVQVDTQVSDSAQTAEWRMM